jgi:hypothetical protein
LSAKQPGDPLRRARPAAGTCFPAAEGLTPPSDVAAAQTDSAVALPYCLTVVSMNDAADLATAESAFDAARAAYSKALGRALAARVVELHPAVQAVLIEPRDWPSEDWTYTIEKVQTADGIVDADDIDEDLDHDETIYSLRVQIVEITKRPKDRIVVKCDNADRGPSV